MLMYVDSLPVVPFRALYPWNPLSQARSSLYMPLRGPGTPLES